MSRKTCEIVWRSKGHTQVTLGKCIH